MDDFMSQNDTVHDLPSFYILGLFLGDNVRQDGFQLVSYYLHDDFVDSIVEGNGSEVLGIGDAFFFWNEG